MSRRALGIQLGSFVAIALLLLIYVLYSVVGISSVGKGIKVSVELPDAAGLFAHANVDYRGQQVGTVSAINLTTAGVTAELQLEQGTLIPADSPVFIHQLSAVGEQFVDFRPDHGGPPYLLDGATIHASQVTLPLPIATALVDLEALVSSINPADLHVVVNELATAFHDTGSQLNNLITGASTLVNDLAAAQPQTVDLLNQFGVVLPTLAHAGGDFNTFSTNLALFTDQLVRSDGDIRALLNNGDVVAPVLDQLVKENNASLTTLLGNLVTTGNILVARVPGLEQLLIVLPRFGSRLAGIVRDGVIQGQIYVDTKNNVCYYGTPVHSPLDPTSHAPTFSAGCATSAPDMLVRGAANAPRPAGDNAVASTDGTAPQPLLAGSSSADGSAQLTTYDPASGLAATPSGELFGVGNGAVPVPDDAALSLLLALISR